MPDICDLILDDHELFRRRFAELDEARAAGAPPERLSQLWGPIATRLEIHAACEEEVFYPTLLDEGIRAERETSDALSDHNDIRHAIRDAGEVEVGGSDWWSAVDGARNDNSDHMAEEERGAIPDARRHADEHRREELGAAWLRFYDEHAGGRQLEVVDQDPETYIAGRRQAS